MTYRRHPLELGPLVVGIVFLGIVAAWALVELGVVGLPDAAWLLPAVLIGAGGMGVVLAATKPSRTPVSPAASPGSPYYASPYHSGQTAWPTTDWTTPLPADDDPTATGSAATDAAVHPTTHPGTGPLPGDAAPPKETHDE